MEKESGLGSKLIKAVVIVILVIVILAGAILAIWEAIVGQIASFVTGKIKGIVEDVGDSVLVAKFTDWVNTSKIETGFVSYILNKDKIELLKDSLDNGSIDTEKAGLTEVRLRKIVLANLVSTTFSDTLCAVEVSEDEILQNIKEKEFGKKFDSIYDFTYYCEFHSQYKVSGEKWKGSAPIDYMLYYEADPDSTVFFYFYDAYKYFDENEAKWYLGSMGATTVTTESGTDLIQCELDEFDKLIDEYNSSLHNLLYDSDGKRKDGAKIKDIKDLAVFKKMNKVFTRIDENTIRVYKFKLEAKEYDYIFDNDNANIEMEGLDKAIYDEEAARFEVQDINLNENIDLNSYAIPIELMLDFLDITGSGEFLEEFIDFAINKTSAEVKAYSTTTEEVKYDLQTYEIEDDFIIEMYDIIDYGISTGGVYIDLDPGTDNFKAYKEIVFDRIYNGNKFKKVTDIPNYEQIKNDDYNVEELHTYLKNAYDPSSTFNLGKIKVTECVATVTSENSWELYPTRITTWYGDKTYSEPQIETIYATPESTGQVTEEEYENFTYETLTEYPDFEEMPSETKEIRYIYKKLVDQVGESALAGVDYSKLETNDIYNDAMETKPGKDNKDHYWNWTMKGLAHIAENDGGNKKTKIGAGEGIDYIYCKYTKKDIKDYNNISKSKTEILNTSNVEQSSENIQEKLEQFLALLKNETGEIGGGEFKKDGIVVKYSDIYEGTIPAGDFLLDNGAEMLFELLEASENTQSMVNVFKYLAYLYTGHAYDGITDASQLGYLFTTTSYSGTDFVVNTTMSEKNLVLTKEQLKSAIEKTYSGKTKENLLSCLDDFMYIQNTNNVNAVFAVAVTIAESSGGTNWAAINPSTYNWMSVKGSYHGESIGVWKKYPSFNEAVKDFGNLVSSSTSYFGGGKYTVKQIAPAYCEEVEVWGNGVVSIMTKIYNNAGVQVNQGGVGGIEGAEGSVTTFTVGSRTYKNYKQIVPAYKNIPLYSGRQGSTLYNAGCAVTSDAIIASGFGHNVTPVDVNNLNSNVHTSILHKYTGLTCTWVKTNVKSGIINQLKKGYPVMVHIAKNSGTFATGSNHYIAILSISEDGNNIYISNPSSSKNGINNGWVKTSVLEDSAFVGYIEMK